MQTSPIGQTVHATGLRPPQKHPYLRRGSVAASSLHARASESSAWMAALRVSLRQRLHENLSGPAPYAPLRGPPLCAQGSWCIQPYIRFLSPASWPSRARGTALRFPSSGSSPPSSLLVGLCRWAALLALMWPSARVVLRRSWSALPLSPVRRMLVSPPASARSSLAFPSFACFLQRAVYSVPVPRLPSAVLCPLACPSGARGRRTAEIQPTLRSR